MRQRPSISITRFVLLLSVTATLLAIGVVTLVSSHVRERSIHDLAREEARQTSTLVFEALYSAMRKGWSKQEVSEIVARLQAALPDLTVRVVRGSPVIEQFGEIDNDLAITAGDPLLQRTFAAATESFVTQDDSIRYLYPLVVREECLACHTQAKAGDVNGIIDIVYPVQNLKVSLDYLLGTVLTYFLVILVLLSLALWIKLKLFVARPIANMVTLMQDIILRTDLRRRVKTTGFISEVADLTEYFNRLLRTVEEYQARLEDLSIRDPLTRLYNRRKLDEFLDHEIDRGERNGQAFCLVQIDLDDFKSINDTFGHPVGDLLLKELASTLLADTRRTDVTARMGADEFMVLLPETDLAEGLAVAEKLRQAIADTTLGLPVGGVRITASLGVVSFPENGADARKLAIAADVATYKAKRGGKNQCASLAGGDDATATSFDKGEMVRTALAEGRLVPFFQPILATRDHGIFAYEVLARVVDGERQVSAGDFIESAEELGLAAKIDEAVFSRALKVLASGALGDARLFINLSARTLADRDRMMGIPARLKAAGVAPSRIVLEITEREALPQFAEVVRLINDLRAQGLAFALDDFGSGFSSFLYLKYITVDYVKIEGSFIRHMVTDERDRIMVEHIHSMARRFGLVTVAEFVEDSETMDLLKAMGIDLAQGYHLGLPVAKAR
ncbi:bifunctional diguanylate cyclase/phosphodiesterase [Magnetospirillum sp. UT-4]|uniref:putative bifunctional diguanylate cyclase/phosphodiesterase n=1 Tax=Magnetospirillum sp. UT-4 TaxID=2681467 RepID=UPI00138241EA|nr:EAL domain-containing protein [Magnetospirillum sp. UT-4]CAA7621462.1 Predicted signal transduction protein [Magnetospirillum sp. UT-4]